ncbi:hypothetical protein [Pedobacter sp. GR22-10]|uniref:hypothetical protein n=1 Tax=Pedobacter sp. GR22-10 TaxID=2994472 RepID=UPI002247D84A|nr:hypothetical protein [Pedobacter sp. GR22-10]MCX2430379.1 hypothetical protein [Pedobacter sp. GR22-10]
MSRPVKIVVIEPVEWNAGNLFGEIISERDGNKLKVRLTRRIKGKRFFSDILMLTPSIENETFKPLHQYYTVRVNGSIFDEQTNEQECVFTSNITYD